MAQPTILRLEGVTKQFAQTAAVAEVTLKLLQGEILALGPSGCGKSATTTVNCWVEQPEVGTVEIAGRPVAGQGVGCRQRCLGMCFKTMRFPLTVAENVAFGLRLYKAEGAINCRRMLLADRSRWIVRLENRYPHELSGGQQQRVGSCPCFGTATDTYTMEMSNLDVQVRLRLGGSARDPNRYVEFCHVGRALSIADQVAVMRQGRLEQIGTPELHSPPALCELSTQANFLRQRRGADMENRGWVF